LRETKNSTNIFTLVEEKKKLDHKPCNNAKSTLVEIIYPAKSITKRSISREHIESADN